MKKQLCVFLVFLLLFSMVGCSSGNKSGTQGTIPCGKDGMIHIVHVRTYMEYNNLGLEFSKLMEYNDSLFYWSPAMNPDAVLKIKGDKLYAYRSNGSLLYTMDYEQIDDNNFQVTNNNGEQATGTILYLTYDKTLAYIQTNLRLTQGDNDGRLSYYIFGSEEAIRDRLMTTHSKTVQGEESDSYLIEDAELTAQFNSDLIRKSTRG